MDCYKTIDTVTLERVARKQTLTAEWELLLRCHNVIIEAHAVLISQLGLGQIKQMVLGCSDLRNKSDIICNL